MSDSDGSSDSVVTAALMVIGDEILSGRTKDQNIGYIADHCTQIGIRLLEVRIVPDSHDEIVDAVNYLRAKYTYVFTTGGIGPTHDDITADCIASAFGVGIDVDKRAFELLKPHYEKSGREITPGRLRMARIPDGADLIENKISIAPGFMKENVITMAGVPKIMQVMLDAVTPRLKTGKKMLSETIDVPSPEGVVAEVFSAHQVLYPNVSMGSYPYRRDDMPRTQLVLRSTDEALLLKVAAELREKLHAEGMI